MAITQFIRTAVVFVALACVSNAALAEIYLKNNSEIVGRWLLESVASSLTTHRTDENRIWEFKPDGILLSTGYNRVLKVDDTLSFGYKVENGKIIMTDPGRPTKPQTYEVYEKTGDAMILKGGSEGFYFLKKK